MTKILTTRCPKLKRCPYNTFTMCYINITIGTKLYYNDTTTSFLSTASYRSLRETDERVPAPYRQPRSRDSMCVSIQPRYNIIVIIRLEHVLRDGIDGCCVRTSMVLLPCYWRQSLKKKTGNIQNDESEKNAVWLLPTRCQVCRLAHAYNTLVNTNEYKM